MTDPIADALTRLRNALKIHKSEVFLPYSKLIFSLFKILEDKNLIAKAEIVKSEQELVSGEKKQSKKINNEIKVILKYGKNVPLIRHIEKVSKPGRRFYSKLKDLRPILGGRGLLIISTPVGLMTDQEAREKKIGGEVICKIY